MTYSTAWQALKGIVRAARAHGLDIPENLSWHDFRRSFATNFYERRPAEIAVLMSLMGHRNSSTIHRYVKPSQRYIDTVCDDFVRELMGDEEE
jgi:integrase